MPTLTGMREWQAPDQLRIKRDPRFGYKYFRKGEVERRFDEGWEICYKNEKVEHETMSLDGAQHYRGLILMRMPIDQVKKRNQYYVDKHMRRLRAAGKGVAVATAAANQKTSSTDNADGELAGAIGKGLVLKAGTVTEAGLIHTDNMEIPVASQEELADLKSDEDKVTREKIKNDEEVQLEDDLGGTPKATPKAGSKKVNRK